jgi:hypothetical protein
MIGIKCTLDEYRYIFLVISLSVLVGMRKLSDEMCTENQNRHFVFNLLFVVRIMQKYTDYILCA